jgi:23S rRNA (cytidine1920-2'-O)/16S rRNA (cytidine1409-2'-O)-methyltransferase
MRLDQELVKRGLCESRTEAQVLIKDGAVVVNDAVCYKQAKDIQDDDKVLVTFRRQYVSRGGDKLQGALMDIFGTNEKIFDYCAHARALDIGSSTGGFTDCLLRFGVGHVDCVDVGTAQLHSKLQGDGRISLFENTDIRNFKSDRKYNIIVADLSFIPLMPLLENIMNFSTQRVTSFFLLIKPQFEVGKGKTKKGIVKDMLLVQEILKKAEEKARDLGMDMIRIVPCCIKGGDGNQEYFLYGKM